MMDIYEVLGITAATPDVEVKRLFDEKMEEFQKERDDGDKQAKCVALRTAYEQLVFEHQNWARTVDDEKRCCANAQIEIIKLQSIKQKNSPEYLQTRSKALLSLLQTERYYLNAFRKYCKKKNCTLYERNEDDFLAFFENQVEKEFDNYIKTYDNKIEPLEHLFNRTMTVRFPDALNYIIKQARSGDVSLDDNQKMKNEIQKSSKVDFYELLLDMSKLITAVYLHGYDTEKLKDKKKSVSESEIQYYRMIFTETVSLIALEQKSGDIEHVHHEKEIFNTMEIPFLDFYTKNICRTIYEISNSPLKKYREIGIEEEGDIALSSKHKGLMGKVYYRYFISIGKNTTKGSVDSTLSRHKKKYYKLLDEVKKMWYESFYSVAGTSVLRKEGNGKFVQVVLEK